MPMFRLARRHLPRIAVLIAAISVVSTIWTPHPEASPSPAQGRSRPAAVPLRDLSFKPDDVPDLGATYYEFEKRTKRVTATFWDSVAVAERTAPERVDVRVTNRGDGVSVATLASVGLTNGRHAIGFEGSTPGERLTTAIEDQVHPTADWAALQARSLWRNREGRRTRGLAKRGRFLGPRGSQPEDVEDSPIFLTSEFPDDIQVTTHRRFKSAEFAQKTTAPYYITRVSRKDTTIGEMWWYPQTQTLEWKFPGLDEGSLSARILARTPHGGWNFRPTPAWANVQAYAIYERNTAVKAAAQAGQQACASTPSALERVAAFFVPSLHADVGCDPPFHWLDNSILRPCCDAHDKCYDTYGCSAMSWISDPLSPSNWLCAGCNAAVVVCFATAGQVGGGGGGGGGNEGGGGLPDVTGVYDVCSRWAGDYCFYPSDCCDGNCDEGFCAGG
jgi:hypothetical protein